MRRVDTRAIRETRSEIRLLTQVRNERLRLPEFLRHHRQLGVDRFFVIDNDSDDGSLEYLLSQPDVHVYHTAEEYRERRRAWKEEILARHLEGCWSLHVDADELFVYPHAEQIDLRGLRRFLEEEGVRGIHATMVDMYADGAIGETRYAEGTSFLEACPYFDAEGYSLHHEPLYKLGRLDRSPSYRVRGGPRERLFQAARSPGGRLERATADWLYDLRRRRAPGVSRSRTAFKVLRSLAERARPRRGPYMSKVPFLRWDADLRLENPAFHFVTPAIALSECWAGLLHFKYLADFAARVEEAVVRGQHVDGAAEYRLYRDRIRSESGLTARNASSRRYESTASLLRAGLMRSSDRYEAFVKRQALEADPP